MLCLDRIMDVWMYGCMDVWLFNNVSADKIHQKQQIYSHTSIPLYIQPSDNEVLL